LSIDAFPGIMPVQSAFRTSCKSICGADACAMLLKYVDEMPITKNEASSLISSPLVLINLKDRGYLAITDKTILSFPCCHLLESESEWPYSESQNHIQMPLK